MSTPSAPDVLAPLTAARLVEFARACKAATRIVSLYPSKHPSIQAALARMVEAGGVAVTGGPFTIAVLPDDLLVGGRRLAKTESSVTELAVLMHQQLIGELTLTGALDGTGWHTFLSLLARTPEDMRAAGGISRAWLAAGGGPIAIKEIDYAEVLREGTNDGASAGWEHIISNCLAGDDRFQLDEQTLATMLEIASDAERFADFAEQLQERHRLNGEDLSQQRRSVMQLMHGLANYAATQSPEALDSVLEHMAGAATRLSPDVMLALMMDPPPLASSGASGARVDVAAQLQSRLTPELIGRFVADNVVKDRGATNRLAAAFHTLVPEAERRRQVLAAATDHIARAGAAQDPQFETVWSASLDLLMSYSDKQYVSEDYARELTSARGQAVQVEHAGDDSPDRISAWLSTVTDEDIRALDQQLILDLLAVEQRPDAWAGVLDVAVARIEQLVLVGDLTMAVQLLESVVNVAGTDGSPFAAMASGGIARLGSGPLAQYLVVFLKQATELECALVGQLCHAVGRALVDPFADALAASDNARLVHRLKDLLIGFGAATRARAEGLRTSTNPLVRRAAIDLLRALGGKAALLNLRPLLDDADSQVQREALRAIIQIGTTEAYALLEQALTSGEPRTREAIMQVLGSLRDGRAAALFIYILTHVGYRGALEGVYVSSVEALGRVGAGDHEALAVLRKVLYGGEWYAPFRTGRLRLAAARALRAIGNPGANRLLQEAVADGSGGVARAARAALDEPATPTTAGKAS